MRIPKKFLPRAQRYEVTTQVRAMQTMIDIQVELLTELRAIRKEQTERYELTKINNWRPA